MNIELLFLKWYGSSSKPSNIQRTPSPLLLFTSSFSSVIWSSNSMKRSSIPWALWYISKRNWMRIAISYLLSVLSDFSAHLNANSLANVLFPIPGSPSISTNLNRLFETGFKISSNWIFIISSFCFMSLTLVVSNQVLFLLVLFLIKIDTRFMKGTLT